MISSSASCISSSVVTFKCRHRRLSTTRFHRQTTLLSTASFNGDEHHFSKRALKYWDDFYKRHQNKFFKDRHYLVKDWGRYFSNYEDDDNGKVLLEVGCASGNTIYPLLDAFPCLYVHACDFSPQAVSLVKAHPDFNARQMNAFVCDVATDDLSISISPSSVDVITLIFTLSAFSPQKMSSVLENLKKVLKLDVQPNYLHFVAKGVHSTQVKLQKKNQLISENFYFRGDGTCSFFFSEDSLSTLFSAGGLNIMDISTYYRQIENRSKNIIMQRYWIRGIFRAD